MTTGFPFRFYGARPDEWFEAANFGHDYELELASEPDAATRLAIAEAWERRSWFTYGVDTEGPPWRWAGKHAQIVLGEDFFGEDRDYDEFFDGVQELFRAVHEVAPIAEVVYANVEGDPGSHPWQAWTTAQKARPSAAPRWGRVETTSDHYGDRERFVAKIATDPAFEARRVQVRRALQAEADARHAAEKAAKVAEKAARAKAKPKAAAKKAKPKAAAKKAKPKPSKR